jgi:hypoxanthine phosphoribosyltransferase
MKVIDANYDTIEEYSDLFINKFSDDLNGGKVLVIGVASGGLPIAKILFNKLNNVNKAYSEVKCQRPSTKNKKQGVLGGCFDFSIKLSPRFLLNFLRVIEHKFLSKNRVVEREVVELTPINLHDLKSIIIIDDAVDSGYSLKSVSDYIKSITSANVITTVYVTTQLEPVFSADFSYKNNVLVRFPWSKDA